MKDNVYFTWDTYQAIQGQVLNLINNYPDASNDLVTLSWKLLEHSSDRALSLVQEAVKS